MLATQGKVLNRNQTWSRIMFVSFLNQEDQIKSSVLEVSCVEPEILSCWPLEIMDESVPYLNFAIGNTRYKTTKHARQRCFTYSNMKGLVTDTLIKLHQTRW